MELSLADKEFLKALFGVDDMRALDEDAQYELQDKLFEIASRDHDTDKGALALRCLDYLQDEIWKVEWDFSEFDE